MILRDSLSIFIIDNDLFCRTLYMQHIHNLGYSRVSLFCDEQECMDQLTTSSTTEIPDVIFLCCCFEQQNGLNILRKIKRINPDIYLVALSGDEDKQAAINAIKYGAFDYIIKGESDFTKIDEVLTKIENVIALLQQRPTGRLSKLLTKIGLL
ncbi:response regulator [Spirosoma pollinicola]|uniref:Response regulator n=1 Tax=Spirosoma pollinicola TaxID=2057025 RepID=A0A2K8YYA2_9BACT|nr:response regulator [Spirosoma pollinicola]AUD02617.1 response regulator [Spirosoma pollinicola]